MPSVRLTALVLVAALAGCGSRSAPSAQTATAGQPTVTTTLDGHRTLPLRFRWLAHPSVPATRVSQVDFLIDGRLRGVEQAPPYNYGSDDFHGHLGWLVTTWLPAGPHRFTARARLTDGTTASDTVIARVGVAPDPPAAIAGRWVRDVTRAQMARQDPTLVGNLPDGRWQLVFDRTGVWELDPHGSGVVEHASVDGQDLAIDAAVWMTPYANGHGHLDRYRHKDIGAGFREDGPPATYRWSVHDNALTLTPIREPTADRRAIWQGVWTRVK